MRFSKYGAVVILSVLMLTGTQLQAQKSGELLQQGLYAEEIEGNLPEAIVHYEKIVNDDSALSKHKAQALYHQAVCYIRLDDEARAQMALTQLMNDHADQTEVVKNAKPLLDKIGVFDPTALMPADTLAYVELGNPGETLKQFVTMLLQLDSLGDSLQIDVEADNEVGEAIMGSLTSSSIAAELGKVGSLAFGLVGIDPDQDTPSFVLLADPGDSDVLRGTLIAALGLSSRPMPELEGMKVMQIPEGPSIAYDDKIFLIAHPAEQLEWSIKQYKGKNSNPSLATENASFKRINKRIRRENLMTLWVDVDGLYKTAQKMVPDFPPEARLVAVIANFASMDDVVVFAEVKDDSAAMGVTLNFNDGMQNLIYEMIRTPTLDCAGLEAVPSSAIALASMAPADANAAQIQQLRMLVQNALGLEIPSALFENIKQISLFLLPGEATVPEGMPVRPGLAIACKDTGPVLETLDMLLAKSPEPLPLLIHDTGSFILIGLEQSVVDDASNALAQHESVNDGGVLMQTVSDHVSHTEKMVLLSASGLAQLMIEQFVENQDLDGEDEEQTREVLGQLTKLMEATRFAVYTDEQPQTLSLYAELTDVPPISELMKPVQLVSKKIQDSRAKVRIPYVQLIKTLGEYALVEIDGKSYARYVMRSQKEDVAPESIILTIERDGEVLETLKPNNRTDRDSVLSDYPWEILLPVSEELLEGTDLVYNSEQAGLLGFATSHIPTPSKEM